MSNSVDPIDGSPPGSSVPGILQARTLEWVAISFSNAWKWKVKVKSLSHVQLLASSIHGIFQARVLEWGAIAFFATVPRDVLNKKWWFFFPVVVPYYLNSIQFCVMLPHTYRQSLFWKNTGEWHTLVLKTCKHAGPEYWGTINTRLTIGFTWRIYRCRSISQILNCFIGKRRVKFNLVILC